MQGYENFSSWSPEQEATFVPFEQRTVETGKKANLVGFGVAGAIFLLVMITVIGFWAPLKAVGSEGESEEEKPAASEPAKPAPAAPAAPAAAAAPATPATPAAK